MLNQVAFAGAVLCGVRKQLPDHVELVVARENLDGPLLARLVVFGIDYLSIVLETRCERESLRKLELPECFGSNDDVLDQFRPQPEL